MFERLSTIVLFCFWMLRPLWNVLVIEITEHQNLASIENVEEPLIRTILFFLRCLTYYVVLEIIVCSPKQTTFCVMLCLFDQVSVIKHLQWWIFHVPTGRNRRYFSYSIRLTAGISVEGVGDFVLALVCNNRCLFLISVNMQTHFSWPVTMQCNAKK